MINDPLSKVRDIQNAYGNDVAGLEKRAKVNIGDRLATGIVLENVKDLLEAETRNLAMRANIVPENIIDQTANEVRTMAGGQQLTPTTPTQTVASNVGGINNLLMQKQRQAMANLGRGRPTPGIQNRPPGIQNLPTPNMQTLKRATGGIVAFNEAGPVRKPMTVEEIDATYAIDSPGGDIQTDEEMARIIASRPSASPMVEGYEELNPSLEAKFVGEPPKERFINTTIERALKLGMSREKLPALIAAMRQLRGFDDGDIRRVIEAFDMDGGRQNLEKQGLVGLIEDSKLVDKVIGDEDKREGDDVMNRLGLLPKQSFAYGGEPEGDVPPDFDVAAFEKGLLEGTVSLDPEGVQENKQEVDPVKGKLIADAGGVSDNVLDSPDSIEKFVAEQESIQTDKIGEDSAATKDYKNTVLGTINPETKKREGGLFGELDQINKESEERKENILKRRVISIFGKDFDPEQLSRISAAMADQTSFAGGVSAGGVAAAKFNEEQRQLALELEKEKQARLVESVNRKVALAEEEYGVESQEAIAARQFKLDMQKFGLEIAKAKDTLEVGMKDIEIKLAKLASDERTAAIANGIAKAKNNIDAARNDIERLKAKNLDKRAATDAIINSINALSKARETIISEATLRYGTSGVPLSVTATSDSLTGTIMAMRGALVDELDKGTGSK